MVVAVISFINGIVSYYYPKIVDLGLIYVVLISVLVWPIRSVYRKSYSTKRPWREDLDKEINNISESTYESS